MRGLAKTAVQSDNPADLDTSLVLDAQENSASFQALYGHWVVPVYQYFYHLTGEVAGAEDLTSQLFLAVYQALPRYQHRGHFAAWLFTIARNLFKENYRKKKREVPLEMALQVQSPSDPPADYALADEIRTLTKLVRSLPDKDQELIRLRYVAELNFSDMAIILDKHEDAVKKSLYRLQVRLQGLLEQSHG
jgi:RNA polymerase sigma factor (sigma-70 family)